MARQCSAMIIIPKDMHGFRFGHCRTLRIRTERLRKTRLHNQKRRAGRHMTALAIAFALIVTPFIVALTHHPTVHAEISSQTSETTFDDERLGVTDTVREHGAGPRAAQFGTHVHNSGGDGHQNMPAGSHNTTDHDHQTHGLICQGASTIHCHRRPALLAFDDVSRNLTSEGPRRPPRTV